MARRHGFIALHLQSLRFGAVLPFRAGALIVSRGSLLFWSMLPICVTLGLYGFVILRAQAAARDALMHQLSLWGWDPRGFAAIVLIWFTRLILILISALTFSIVASVAASPFNDSLALRAERFAKPALPAVAEAKLIQKIRLVFIDLGKSIAAAVATLAALLLSWVPGLNLVAFALAFLLVTFQYISYPQTRRGQGLGEGLRFLVRHPWACLAFGGTLSLFFAIPLVSAFVVPLAVVGGTMLVARAGAEPPLK